MFAWYVKLQVEYPRLSQRIRPTLKALDNNKSFVFTTNITILLKDLKTSAPVIITVPEPITDPSLL